MFWKIKVRKFELQRNTEHGASTLDKMQRADMVLILGLFLPMSFVFNNGKHFLIETEKNEAIK